MLTLATHLLHLEELVASVFVVAQILLVGHQDYGNVGAEMLDLRSPFLGDVLCGVREVSGARAPD